MTFNSVKTDLDKLKVPYVFEEKHSSKNVNRNFMFPNFDLCCQLAH